MHNPAILTPVQYCMFFIIIGAAFLLSLLILDKRLEIYPWLIIFRNAPHIMIIGIIIPLIFFVKNRRAWTYIKREFWNRAPDCFQKYNPYQLRINIIMKSEINATNKWNLRKQIIKNQIFRSMNKVVKHMWYLVHIFTDHQAIKNIGMYVFEIILSSIGLNIFSGIVGV